MDRIAFSITLGIMLKTVEHRKIRLSSIFRSRFIKILLCFSFFVIIISLEDRFENIVFTYIPRLIVGIMLCFILVRDKRDLQKLVMIFSIQAALISILVILEYFTPFNPLVWIRRTIPGVDMYRLQTKGFNEGTRAGFYRPAGIGGSAVHTAYILVFFFPLVLWFAFNKKIIGYLFPGVLAIAFILLRTRTGLIGVAVSMIWLAIILTAKKQVVLSKNFIRLVGFLCISVTTMMLIVNIFSPEVSIVFKRFLFELFIPSLSLEGDARIKYNRIPIAIDYIMEKPIMGYGSPWYAYLYIMNTADLPAPFIYAIAGGIPLVAIYLVMLFYMPYSVFKASRRQKIHSEDRLFLYFASAAFIGGVVVIFSNWIEVHFTLMYMLYISLYNVYIKPSANIST